MTDLAPLTSLREGQSLAEECPAPQEIWVSEARLEPPQPSGGQICLQRDTGTVQLPGLVGTCCARGVRGGGHRDSALRSSQWPGGMRLTSDNCKPWEAGPQELKEGELTVEMWLGGGDTCNGS